MTIPVNTDKRISSIFWGRTRFKDMQTSGKWGDKPLTIGMALGTEDAEPDSAIGTERFDPIQVETQADQTRKMVEMLWSFTEQDIDQFRAHTGINLYEEEDRFLAALYEFIKWGRTTKGWKI